MIRKLENLKLMNKLLLCIWMPLGISAIVSLCSIMETLQALSSDLVKSHLIDMGSYITTVLEHVAPDESYVYKNNKLYKGDINISDTSLFNEFKENTQVDVSILYNGMRINSSIKEYIGQPVDDNTYQELCEVGKNFYTGIKIGEDDYYGYYEIIDTDENGNNVMVFTGIKSGTHRDMYISRLPIMILCLIGPSFLFGIIAILAIKKITNRIKIITSDLNKLANCDLTIEISENILNRKEEIGDISRSVDKVIKNLTVTVEKIKNSVKILNEFMLDFKDKFESINASTVSVNSAINEIATGVVNQAGDTLDVNNKMSEVGVAVSNVSDNITILDMETESMQKINLKLNDTLRELINISDTTKSYIDTVNEQTTDTNKASKDIQSVVDIISDIAEQTNLLSLNASIEAAHAGEQGRGFAVVATEVRALAEQCKQSAEEISSIVTNLSNKSSASVNTMKNVMKEISNQHEKLDDTEKVFTELNRDITNVSNAVELISNNIHVIDESKNSVLGSLENLAAVSQQNAAATEETSSIMQELGEITNSCNQSVNELMELCDEINTNLEKFKL